MPRETNPKRLRLLALPLAVLSLTACELRNTGDEPPAAEPTADATDGAPLAGDPSPEPSASETAAASIIRDEKAGADTIALPPRPLQLTIPFPDGADLSEEAERALANVMSSEALAQGWPVVIGGHTDSSGFDQANLRASRARAEAVAAWLVERGVADDRIEVIAFGEQNPVAPNALPNGKPNEEGRRANRRVELSIAPPKEPARSPATRRETGKAGKGA